MQRREFVFRPEANAAPNPQQAALAEACAEAQRFIDAAKEVFTVYGAVPWCYPTKEKAAAKRASLDLPRALAKFRNP